MAVGIANEHADSDRAFRSVVRTVLVLFAALDVEVVADAHCSVFVVNDAELAHFIDDFYIVRVGRIHIEIIRTAGQIAVYAAGRKFGDPGDGEGVGQTEEVAIGEFFDFKVRNIDHVRQGGDALVEEEAANERGFGGNGDPFGRRIDVRFGRNYFFLERSFACCAGDRN